MVEGAKEVKPEEREAIAKLDEVNLLIETYLDIDKTLKAALVDSAKKVPFPSFPSSSSTGGLSPGKGGGEAGGGGREEGGGGEVQGAAGAPGPPPLRRQAQGPPRRRPQAQPRPAQGPRGLPLPSAHFQKDIVSLIRARSPGSSRH